jgi:hypothetical protein
MNELPRHMDSIVGFSLKDRVDRFISAVAAIGTGISELAKATQAVARAIRERK